MFVTTFVHNQYDYWVLNHKVTFDGAAKLIYINDATTNLDMKIDLYSDWKEWVTTRDNSKYLPAIRTVGGDATISGQFAGDMYFMINGWRLVVDLTKVKITGVLFSDDYDTPWLDETTMNPVFPAQVSSLVNTVAPSLDGLNIPTATQTAQEVWEYVVNGAIDGSYGEVVRAQAFNNTVHIDQNNGTAGTAYPIGTINKPSNNITDALVIAGIESIDEFHIIEDITIPNTADISGFTIRGSHATKSQITVTAGATTEFTQFHDCLLKGTLNGQIIVRDSMVEDLFGFEGLLHQTMINGDIQLGGTRGSHFLSCYSGFAGQTTPEIDFNNQALGLAVRDMNGGLKFINKTSIEAVTVDFNAGQLILDGTVVDAGDIVIRGIYGLTNNSSGATNVIRLTNIDEIQADTDTIIEDLTNVISIITEIRKYGKNRSKIDPNNYQMIIYDDDNVTPIQTFDLKDRNGVSSILEIFDKIPV